MAQRAAGRPGAFLRLGVGARALALGGAFSAIADDPSAVYWNPAGIAQLHHAGFIASYHSMPLERSFYFVGAAVPLRRSASIGVSWIGWNVSNIEGRTGNTAEPDFIFNNNENALVATYAHQLGSSFELGGNLKVIFQNLYTGNSTGWGMDLAALFRPMNNLRLGLALQDINTATKWSTGLREKFPMTMRLGAAINISTSVQLALELNKINGEKFGFSGGAEYTALSMLPFRLGFTERGAVGGLGLAIPLRSMQMHFDYAYTTDVLDGGRAHKLSLGLSLLKKMSRADENKLMMRDTPMEAASAVSRKVDDKKIEPTLVCLEAAKNSVPVRIGPGDNYKRIAIDIKKGRQFTRFSATGDWYKVELVEGKYGWVRKKDVKEVMK